MIVSTATISVRQAQVAFSRRFGELETTQERFTYLYRWRVGDLVMYDNRALLHRAALRHHHAPAGPAPDDGRGRRPHDGVASNPGRHGNTLGLAC